MKFLKKSFFLYLFLALVFSVVVSGGCGGGGGGHYSGDFGNSGDSNQDVTLEPENQDVINNNDLSDPVPDEPAISDQFGNDDSDSDEYGAGRIDNSLKLLHATVWKIESIDIVAMSGQNEGKHCELVQTYTLVDIDDDEIKIDNIQDIQKIAFLISGDFISWADPVTRRNYPSNNITVQFYDANDNNYYAYAPFFRNSNNFKKDEDEYSYMASFKALTSGDWGGSEQIEFSETSGQEPYVVAKSLVITNDFKARGVNYRLTAYLTIDLLASLNQTYWQIKDIKVFDAKDGKITPDKFPVDRASFTHNTSLLTLFISDDMIMSDDKEVSISHLLWADGNNTKHYNRDNRDILYVKFCDTTRESTQLYAPLIRPESNMRFIGITNGHSVFQSASKYEVVYISDYGPNAELTINNFCSYTSQNYKASFWVSLTLEPYNQASLFSKLNGTDWVIDSATAYWHDENTQISTLVYPNSYNYDTGKLSFMTSGNLMSWKDGNGKQHNQESSDNVWLNSHWLTVKILNNISQKVVNVPVLRTASGFEQTQSDETSVTYEATVTRKRFVNGSYAQVESGTETISIAKNFPSQVIITNTFNYNDFVNRKCTTVLKLSPKK